MNEWITLYGGIQFFPFNPNIEVVTPEIIAHSLSNICRFAGHVNRFMSIAEHSYNVSYLCEKEKFYKPSDRLAGLIHEGSEGLGFVDLPRPIKYHPELIKYRYWENNCQEAVFKKFCGIKSKPKSVRLADRRIVYWEAHKLFKILPAEFPKSDDLDLELYCWTPKQAEKHFLDRFYQLYGTKI